jgi:valyl-tRNA synthetase
MRNFTNKLWNIGRYIEMSLVPVEKSFRLYDETLHKNLIDSDKRIITELNMLVASVTEDMEKFRLSEAAQNIYEFSWHRVADTYIEDSKERIKNGDVQTLAVLLHIFRTILKLLHPFMPFITEELWNKFPRNLTEPLIISHWPTKYTK